MTTAEKIKAARKTLGLTQRQLAKRSGVPQQRISQYESGVRKPKLGSVYLLADALEVNPEDLVDLKDYGLVKPKNEGYVVNIPKRNIEIFQHLLYGDAEPLLNQFERLNSFGKRVAIDRLQELTEIPRYQNPLPENWKEVQDEQKEKMWKELAQKLGEAISASSPAPEEPEQEQESK